MENIMAKIQMDAMRIQYVKNTDNILTIICLKALEVMNRPFSFGGFLLRLIAVLAVIALVALLAEKTGLIVLFAAIFVFAVLSVIGAQIRDKRIRESKDNWE